MRALAPASDQQRDHEQAACSREHAAGDLPAQHLAGPGRVADGTTNLMGALRRSMATTGYSDLKEFQRIEVVVQH